MIQYILIFLAFFVAGTGALLASTKGEPTPGPEDRLTVEDVEQIVADHIDTRLREAREAQHRDITEKQLRELLRQYIIENEIQGA